MAYINFKAPVRASWVLYRGRKILRLDQMCESA